MPTVNEIEFAKRAQEVLELLEHNYPRYAIIAAGIGTERLLQVLFEELNDYYRSDVRRSYRIQESLNEVRKVSGNWALEDKDLTFSQWSFRYKSGKFLNMLTEAFGYAFKEFSIASIEDIRLMRNKCAHSSYYNDLAAIDYEIDLRAQQIRDSFLNSLLETRRIAWPRLDTGFEDDEFSLLDQDMPKELEHIEKLFTDEEGTFGDEQFRLTSEDIPDLVEAYLTLNNDMHDLYTVEDSPLKRQYDEFLLTNPEDIDALFLRAHLLRGEKAALDDIVRILVLHPSHSEARDERNWNRDFRV